MNSASLRVSYAGPLVSYQDCGRPGHMRFGVPSSGPMDRLSHAAANVALGNAKEKTAIEISMGGLALECTSGALSLALAGSGFTVEREGKRIGNWRVFALSCGEKLSIRPGKKGSWAYLAFAGSVDVPQWLGHTATHSTSGFGAGQLTAGSEIRICDAAIRENRHGGIETPKFLKTDNTMRVVCGPQDRCFKDKAMATFLSEQYVLTSAFDRMGVRLSGPKLELTRALSIPSEPVTRGSVQVAGDSVPTVLLADHQTTGGYPKIATVISDDLDRLSQMRSLDPLRFVALSPADAVQIARENAALRSSYLAGIATPKDTLEQRLMRENLISGVIS